MEQLQEECKTFQLKRPIGMFEFMNPGGKCIPDAPELRFCRNAFELMAKNIENEIVIGPRTAIPNCDGEGMDVDVVMHGLWLRQE